MRVEHIAVLKAIKHAMSIMIKDTSYTDEDIQNLLEAMHDGIGSVLSAYKMESKVREVLNGE